MSEFFKNIPPDEAEHIDRIAKLAFELRENRKLLLARHGAAEEAELAARIASGEVAEHPAYEDYLGAGILEQARLTIREELKQYMLEVETYDPAS